MLRNMQRGAAEPNFAQQQQFHQQLLARGMPNGMMMKQQGNPLQRAAMANNQKYVPGTTASPSPSILGSS